MARTLDELAALTGVSRATVSRVINGGSVAAATRSRVMAVLEEEQYRPNLAARSLASGRTGVVGVVIHEAASDLFQDPYFSLLLHGITEALADTTTGVMLWLGHKTKEETRDSVLRMGLLDGVIATAQFLDDPLIDGLLASDLPTVLVGHRRSDLTASYVDIDNISAADALTTHLIGLGRTRIGHITGTRGTIAAEDRLAGYLAAMRRAGLPTEGLIHEAFFNIESGFEAATQLLNQNLDALFCANDATAKGALEAIKTRGLRIPDDIALAGFDDLEFAAHLDPPLTTVRQGIEMQGREAARALAKLLDHSAGGPQRVLLPTELVIRQSTIGGVPAIPI